MKAYLNKLWQKKDLSSHEVEKFFTYVQQGHIDELQLAAFLSSLQTKGTTSEELFGAYSYLTKEMIPPLGDTYCVHVMGTGKTDKPFNISTCAALIASKEVPIVKQASRAIYSSCGCADIIDALGLKVDSIALAKKSLREKGISFLHPNLLHPMLSEVINIRRSLQMPTIFDLVIPFLPFSTAKRHLIGLYSLKSYEIMEEFLDKIGDVGHILCLYGTNNLDEISLSAPTKIIEKKGAKISTYTFSPAHVGLEERKLPKMKNSWDSSQIIIDILQNKQGPYLDIAALNAGAILYIGERAASIEEGYYLAKELLQEGCYDSQLKTKLT